MDINTEVHKAYEVIQNGGIILYPTDTVWGIGCDASNEEAVEKIYALKRSTEKNSMIVLMNGDKMMYTVFKEIPDVAWELLDLSDPSQNGELAKQKPTTLILDNPRNVAKNIIADDNSLGIRIVKEPFCFKVMERMKRPLVSTSANFSGSFSPKSFKEIDPEIIKGVDYVVNLEREKICKNPSTIIKLSLDNQVKIIRK
jgi:L-threonylcarbamoyladenylate synthase